MVTVRVRETYDLKTVQNKMTVIGIHTPNPDIIKKNYPGLLMQCKAYRPSSCDVRVASASVLPLDPLGVGTGEGDVAPEDVFNPILYRAMSNKGMSMLEARINRLARVSSEDPDVVGQSAIVDVDNVTEYADEFDIYYGLLSDASGWKKASPQSGLEMSGLRPLVYDVLAVQGDMAYGSGSGPNVQESLVQKDLTKDVISTPFFLGKAKEMPFINCTSYSLDADKAVIGEAEPGFPSQPKNAEVNVPWVKIMCGCIIIPPSRLHELFFRMVVSWDIEFSMIRPLSEIMSFNGIHDLGTATHFQNYDYSQSKKVATGSSDSILDNSDTCMVASNVDLKKVM